jgi:hypothetical protein
MGYVIKEYFANYFLHMSDVTFDTQNKFNGGPRKERRAMVSHLDRYGDATMTGGRLRRVAPYLQEEDPFCFTYGDGLANVDVSALIAFHRRYGKLATITAVQPPCRHGALNVVESKVLNFMEKPRGDGALINGGLFALSPASSTRSTGTRRRGKAISRFGLNADSVVVKLLPTMGTCFNISRESIQCYGIEPTSSTAEAARSKGVEIVQAFFRQGSG